MLLHSLETENPNIINLTINMDDVCEVEISLDGQFVACGLESGKIQVF